MENTIVENCKPMLSAFREQCAQQPDKIALVHDESTISYAELDKLSDSFAHAFHATGVAIPGSIAFLCDRNIQVIAAMFGCLKCGVPFVPIDTALPDERVSFMLLDASVSIMVVDVNSTSRAQSLAAGSAIVQLPLDSVKTVDNQSAYVNTASDNGNARAYIMYTSGSTGKPKGVPISQAALACYCEADAQVYQLSAADRTLQFATLSFDISIEEIFPPLITGGTVVLRPAQRRNAQIELSDIIERYSITAVHLATGYWHEWVDLMMATDSTVPECLRLMVVTGEAVSPEHYARWLQLCSHDVLWANAYGPTETTVSATVFIPEEGWQGNTLPIGKALPGYAAHILDEQMRPVEPEQTGELYIGGGALAEGYLNRPELTASAFVPDPFNVGSSARLYRTGDLARWRKDGHIEYAGRIDHQLKFGSYRIEPGEIENVINQLAGIDESLVMAARVRERTQLIAYIALNHDIVNASEQAAEIKQQLVGSLPEYMVPYLYVLLPQLPKTINGKTDRKALPDPATAILPGRHNAAAPRNQTERAISEIWMDSLGVLDVGIHDSFLSLGGDSLLAIRVIAGIQKQLDFTVSTRDFFFLDTIALLAAHIQGEQVQRLLPPVNTFFINQHRHQVYSVLQAPESSHDNGVGILLVPPVGNEQRRVQRPNRSFMHKQAREGFHVLRFDWQGTGNSSCRSHELDDLSLWRDNLRAAALRLSETVEHIHIVSVRFGAMVCAGSELLDLPVRSFYHWYPVISGHQWLNEMQSLQQGIQNDTFRFLFKRKSRTDVLHEFAGFTMNPSLHATINSLDLLDALKTSKCKFPVHLLTPEDAVIATDMLPSNVSIHSTPENNDWANPRATTDDIKINQVARVTMDMINAESGVCQACP